MATEKAPPQKLAEVEPATAHTVREGYYKNNYSRLITTSTVLAGIVAAGMALCFLVYSLRPAPEYYSITTKGKKQLTALSSPNLATGALLSWAAQAATAAFTFTFVNYKNELENLRINFTPIGYQNFVQSLTDNNSLEAIESKKLVISGVPTGTPVILQEGMVGEYYAWRIQLPMLISYQSASDLRKDNIIVTMLITRVSTLESATGVGISQLTVQTGG